MNLHETSSPHQSGLLLLDQTLPAYLWASDDKRADRKMDKEQAIGHRYIQINSRNLTSWLIFDLDHDNAMIWEDMVLPAPNLIVRNPENGHSHLFYAIAAVSTSEKSRQKPIRYMEWVRDQMKIRLNADMAYSGGPLAKNPFHPYWMTTNLHDTKYDLNDFMEYFPDEDEDKEKGDSSGVKPSFRKKVAPDDGGSRHVTLFHQVRRFAYDNVHDFKENGLKQDSFMESLLSFAEDRNHFNIPLPFSSLKATARSVARWTWNRYTGQSNSSRRGKRINRGVMELQATGYRLSYKQRLAALRTASIKRSATEKRIHTVCERMHKDGTLDRSSQSGIAALCNITRQGIQRYRDLVLRLKHEFGQLSLEKYQNQFISSLCQLSSALGIGVLPDAGERTADGESTQGLVGKTMGLIEGEIRQAVNEVIKINNNGENFAKNRTESGSGFSSCSDL